MHFRRLKEKKNKKTNLLRFTLVKNGRTGTRATVGLAKDKEKHKDEKSFLQKAGRYELPMPDWHFQRLSALEATEP